MEKEMKGMKELEPVKIPEAALSNGVRMPVLGFGVYQLKPEECERCVFRALQAGYRLIDAAQAYFNEEAVGRAILQSGIPRQEIFLTTKLWLEFYDEEKAVQAIERSLERLQTSYLDLVLLHQPYGDVYGAWRGLETLYKKGVVKAIGISNFYEDRMVEMVRFASIPPMVNQVEVHLLNQQQALQKWAGDFGIQLQAWAPLGQGNEEILENEVLKAIARAHQKTPAQVALRWLYQQGIAIVCKSSNPIHMQENLNIFDFELSEKEMKALKEQDRKTSLFFDHHQPQTVEYFVNRILQRKGKL